jgi:hypothetical protein
MREFPQDWRQDREVGCRATFRVTAKSGIGGSTMPGDLLTLTFQLAPTVNGVAATRQERDTRALGFSGNLVLPNVILLPADNGVRQAIDWTKLNSAETRLFQFAFGHANHAKFMSLSDELRTLALGDAEERLNERLSLLLPPKLLFRFRLRELTGKPEMVLLSLVDEHQSAVPARWRGAGIRSLLDLMAHLAVLDVRAGNALILIDEPENSLHADAQHSLRRYLELLGSNEFFQVIYSTHSPAMVNTLLPQSLRVLKRGRVATKATALIENEAFQGNFWHVRSSLGVTPADSLLFGSVTVVVEGTTEIRCLPRLLQRLVQSGDTEFSAASDVLGQSHFLDGGGSSCIHACGLAMSQRANPVVFLDGDKEADAAKIRSEYPPVRVILLPRGKEFEQLVPEEHYFAALAEVCQLGDPNAVLERFRKFVAERRARTAREKMFSKWVDWFMHEESARYDKDVVMEKAVEMVPIDKVEMLDVLRALMQALKSAAGV